jgi:mannose-6-phosphate isomerase
VLSAILHAKFPSLYKDPNHKPKMVIALIPFEALIGFRPLEEIAQTYPEFKEFFWKKKVKIPALYWENLM